MDKLFRCAVLLLLNIGIFWNEALIDVYVPTGSMKSTLDVGSELIAVDIKYVNIISRGDIIIFRCSADNDDIYIKRIIGLPGEHIEIRNKSIYVNHSTRKLDESYIYNDWEIDNDNYVFDVPENSYLVLGDNRNDSYDARYWNIEDRYVNQNDIVGKAYFKYSPSLLWLD